MKPEPTPPLNNISNPLATPSSSLAIAQVDCSQVCPQHCTCSCDCHLLNLQTSLFSRKILNISLFILLFIVSGIQLALYLHATINDIYDIIIYKFFIAFWTLGVILAPCFFLSN